MTLDAFPIFKLKQKVMADIRKDDDMDYKQEMVKRLKEDCKVLIEKKIPKALENVHEDKGINTYRNLTKALAENIRLIDEYESGGTKLEDCLVTDVIKILQDRQDDMEKLLKMIMDMLATKFK